MARPLKRKLPDRSYCVEVLEPRLLLAADWLAGLAPAWTTDGEFDVPHSELGDLLRDNLENNAESHARLVLPGPLDLGDLLGLHSTENDVGVPVLPDAQPDAANHLRHELVVIDAGVEGYEELVADFVNRSSSDIRYDVHVLAADSDGVRALTELLAGYSDLDAFHIVSHGNDGGLQLGEARLDNGNVDSYELVLRAWSASLGEDADLMIYGCDLAGSEAGEALMKSLARLTNTDVAASTDATGQAALGGDWLFEYVLGDVATEVAFSTQIQSAWTGVLATFVVNTTADTVDANPGDGLALDAAGNTSLRAAIMEANALAGADTIELPSGTYTLTISGDYEDAALTGDLDISQDLTIEGEGAVGTIIDANDLDRVFDIIGAIDVSVSGMTIQGGNSADAGGGIYNADGTLTIKSVTIRDNSADGKGGGIYNDGDLRLDSVTISGNTAASSGGGLYSEGSATNSSLTNVTVSGNLAASSGGGIYLLSDANLLNVTVTGNSTDSNGGGLNVDGGITTITNTIVAGNLAGGLPSDVRGAVVSDGSNLILEGADSSGLAASEIGVDPLLDPFLRDNGGSTWTHALLAGSPAIDSIAAAPAPAIDQRGYLRDAFPDIGAFEDGGIGAGSPFVVNTFNDTIDINPGDGFALDASGSTSLRAAIMESNALPGADTIILPAGVYDLTIGGFDEDAGATGDLDIRQDLTIVGAGAGTTVIDAGDLDRVIEVHSVSAPNVAISGVTIQGGDTTAAVNSSGGGIRVRNGASLTLTDAALTDNQAFGIAGHGGGVASLGNLQLVNVEVSNNKAQFLGGGVYLGFAPVLTSLTNVTISGNFADEGGGAYSDLSPTLTNVTIADNTAVTRGGGISAQSGASPTLTNSLVANNSAPLGPDIDGMVTSTGDNLVFDPQDALGLQGSDITLVNPNLGVLWDNGGGTRTHALIPFSPAIDTASVGPAPANDQRGVARDGTPDIGAYEFSSNNAPVANDDSYDVDADTTLVVTAGSGLLANDTDIDLDPLILYLLSAPANGSVSLNPLGLADFENVTMDLGLDASPEWSPDGSKIAFSSFRGGEYEIYTINADGTGLMQLTSNAATELQPVWSPDGTQILYRSDAAGTFDIYVMDADGSNPVRLTTGALSDGANEFDARWSPDGSKIVYVTDIGNPYIWVMNSDGSNPTALTTPAASDTAPAWSPDGNSIVFVSNRDGNDEVYVMDADGTNPVRLTTNALTDGAPTWSPDGSKILFHSDRDGDFEIFVMDADGSNLLQITDNADSDISAVWSPDGTRIAFQTDRDGNPPYEIYVSTILSDGGFTYTPKTGFTGVDSFTYQVTDGTDTSAPATVTINVGNSAPMATNLTQSIGYVEDAVSVALANIVVTDADVGETITATLTLSDIVSGALSANSGNGETYTAGTGVWEITGTVAQVNAALAAVAFIPAADSNANTTISTHIEDSFGSGPAPGIITLNGTAVNDAPTFSMPGNINVLEDSGPHTVAGFATAMPGGGLDESGQTFIYTVNSDNPGLFLVGPAIDASGTLTYTLNPNLNGTAQVTVSVTDSGGTANGGDDTSIDKVFDIIVGAVNDVPSFSTLGDQNVLEDSGPHSIAGFATALPGGGPDESGQTFTYTVNSDNPGLFLVGPAIDASGTLTYTLNPNAVGTATVTVSVTDSGGTANGGIDTSPDQTFDIIVGAVNDVPSFSTLGDQNVLEDSGPHSVASFATALPGGGPDEAGQTFTYTVNSDNPGLFLVGPAIDASGTLTYTLNPNAVGTATVTVSVTDSGGTANGGVDTSSDQTFDIVVGAVNDVPSFSTLGNQNVLEDSGPHSIAGFATALPGGGPDEFGQTFTYTVNSDSPGLFLVGPAIDASGTLTYTLNPNAVGTTIVTVSVTDSGGTANGGIDTSPDQTFDIVVGAVNDVPSFSTLGDQNVLEDSGPHSVAGFATALPGGGTDESGQTFTYTVNSDNPGLFLVGPAIDASGTLTYTLNPNAVGTATVTVSVTDSGGTANGGVDTSADQTFDIIVGAVNDLPSFSTLGNQNVLEDSGPHTVAGFATALPGGGPDEAGQSFSYTVNSDNPGLFLVGPAIDASGTLTYTLNPNAVGTATVTVSVTDSGGTANGGVDTSADQTFDIVVGAVNDVPSFSTLGDQIVLEDSGPHSVASFATALPGGGPDETGQTFSYAVNSDNPGLFLVGPAIDASGTLTYTLNPNAVGTATVTVSVTDSGGTANGGVDTSADQTFDIVVGAVNDVPSFSTLGDQNVLEDSGPQSVAGFATALPGGGPDEAGQTFTYTVNSDNPGLFLVGPAIDASGTLTYTLNPNAVGTATVTVSVTDSGGTANGGVDTSSDQTFDIVVGAVNDVPSFSTLGDQNVLEDSGPQSVAGFATALPGGGPDEAGQTFTYTVNSDNPGLFLTGPAIDASGTLTYTLNPNAVGTATVTVSVTDSGGTANGGVDRSADQNFDIIVGAVNDRPSLNTLRDQSVLEDSGPHTVVGFATPLPGGGPDEAGQTFTYTVNSDNPGLFLTGPAIDASGTLTYTLNPNAVGTATVTVSVTDSGGTANGGIDTLPDQTFDITVGAVNDAPSFSTLGDQNVLESSGSHTVAGFATALPGGGMDESGQTFTYTVNNDNPGLFLVGPAVDASGTLTYTLNPNLNGTARVMVSVTDSGGTANGGVDTSADQTFDIVVVRVDSAPAATNLDQVKSYLEDSGAVALNDITVTDSDVGDLITATLTLSDTSAGSLTAASGNGETYTVITGVWTVTGSVAQVNAALAAVAFVPVADNAINASIITHIEDLGGQGPADGVIVLNVVSVNDGPMFSTLGDQNVLEDSGAHTVAGFATALPGGGMDESGQTFTYTVSSDNPGLFLVGPAIDASGTLTYTLNPNLNGTARVTASVTDSGGTANGGVDTSTNQTFNIIVGAVNDAPSFSTLGDQNVFEGSGSQTVADFATALPGGGADESGQTFTYLVSSDNPNLFSVGPSIDAFGTLTYTLNPNVVGTTTVTVSVTDSGGTANGGIDLSADQVFEIVVAPLGNVPIATNLDQVHLYVEDSGPVALHDILVNVGGASGLVSATLTLSDTAAGSLSAGSGNGENYTPATGVWTITGNVSQVNAALAAVTFIPAANNDLSTTLFTHIENAAGQGPADGLITLGVTPVNDPPAGEDAVLTVIGDSVHVFTMADFGFSDPVEGHTALAVEIASLPAWSGTLLHNGAIVSVGDVIDAEDIIAGRLQLLSVGGRDFASLATLAFRVQDAGGTAAGGIDLDPVANYLTIIVDKTAEPGFESDPIAADQPVLAIAQVDQVANDLWLKPDRLLLSSSDTGMPHSQVSERIVPAPVQVAHADGPAIMDPGAFPLFHSNAGLSDGEATVTTPKTQAAPVENTAGTRQPLAASPDDIALGLDMMRDAVAQDISNGQFILGRSAAGVLGLSVGYVSWLLRGGVLLSSVLSSLPVWRFVDPLPVFARERDRQSDDGDDESLEAIVRGGRPESQSTEQPLAPDTTS